MMEQPLFAARGSPCTETYEHFNTFVFLLLFKASQHPILSECNKSPKSSLLFDLTFTVHYITAIVADTTTQDPG